MASVVSEDENSDDNFSDFSQYSLAWEENMCERNERDFIKLIENTKPSNVVTNIFNRQVCLFS